MQVEIDERELGTILAALRHWQETSEEWSLTEAGEILTGDKGGLLDIATDGGKFSALTPSEVNALCERINQAPVLGPTAILSQLECPRCGGALRFVKFPDELWCPSCDWVRGYRKYLEELGLLALDRRKLEGRPNDQQTETGEDGRASPRRV